MSPAYIAGIDLYPLETFAGKKEFLEKALKRKWILYFYHEPRIKAGCIMKKNGGYVLEKIHL